MVGIEPPTTGGVFEYTLHQCCAWLYTAQSAWVSVLKLGRKYPT